MDIVVRDAGLPDLDALVALTRSQRLELANWAPRYWNPRAGADQLHPHFLRYCVENPGIEVRVATESGELVGCVVLQAQRAYCFADDFCVAGARWSDVGAALIAEPPAKPMIACCPRADSAQRQWLIARGSVRKSEYHSIMLGTVDGGEVLDTVESAALDEDITALVVHTFSNGMVDPHGENALVISTSFGRVVGSAPMQPPIYDPGGPTTVVDRVVGADRAALLDETIRAARRRGDAQLIVVCADEDTELRALLHESGSAVPVDVWEL